MGLSISKLFDTLFGKKETKILMFGLDAAGKTTILYKLKLGKVVNTIPTIGFNVETVKHKRISFTVWDIPPRENLKPLIRHYFSGTHGLIFVVDSHDCERIDEAKTELLALIRADELRDIPILVFANKKDISFMSAEKIREKLELNKRETDSWHIQESNAITGDGLSQGLEWLSQAILKKR